MREFLEQWKPRARARHHVLAAALLWTCVGLGLTAAGLHWCLGADPPWPAALMGAGVTLGILKGRVALEKAARKAAARIAVRGDDRCLGGFLSWQTWLFVLAMMGLGAALRHSEVPRALLGVVYTAVGAALLWGSRTFWAVWSRTP
ncbi:MAG: hypothetical protein HZB55_10105 [Deltaproteobacteria bacterium]|nr:hypothetical protein [Deltaproteobacteria bacterium]